MKKAKLNQKRLFLAGMAAFVFVFFFEWVFHGILLKPAYQATANLWRPEEQTILWAMFLGQLMMPFVMAYLFTKNYENKGLAEGVRFGFLIGLLFVPTNLVFYAVQPLPGSLVTAWTVGGLIESCGIGAVLAAVYRK